MSRSRSVVHLTSSPLAGAPSRLAAALNAHTAYRSVVLRHGVISERQRPFEPDAVSYNSPEGFNWEFCASIVAAADIIHVHNQLPVEAARLIATNTRNAPIVYHVHSPPAERPNFFHHAPFLPSEPDALVVVPHFHPRCYWEYTMLPNVVVPPATGPLPQAARPTVMFSPSHYGGGRWNTKAGPRTEQALAELSRNKRIQIEIVEDMAPGELLQLRQAAAFSIDEVETGSYHQVSIEALATGSIGINNMDTFCRATFAVAYRTAEDPPFLVTGPDQLATAIGALAENPERLWQQRLESRSYFERHMMPSAVASLYAEFYDGL